LVQKQIKIINPQILDKAYLEIVYLPLSKNKINNTK